MKSYDYLYQKRRSMIKAMGVMESLKPSLSIEEVKVINNALVVLNRQLEQLTKELDNCVDFGELVKVCRICRITRAHRKENDLLVCKTCGHRTTMNLL